MTEQNENQGNWNQPWLWITLTPLILSVVLGLTMLNISFQIQDGLVTDEYSKEGLTINERIEKEEHAKNLSTQANISVDKASGEMTVLFDSELEQLPNNLLLELIHPIIKDKDQKVVLTHQGNGRYAGQVADDMDGKRYVRLQELQNSSWVLKGELHFDVTSQATISAQ
ncbi:FixH family protein [Litoribrevibacter euphylliae]|uniref:FixH family protein n=1 Tax=Litoribrevibacter euphylliae TaxID=1834034 RepID=A0ABV7HEQ1_9GAMM